MWVGSGLTLPQNGGHCQPNVYIPPPHISHWELANFSFLRSFIARNNIPCDWQDTQGVHGFYNKAIFDVAVLDAAANAKLDPELAKQVRVVRPEDTEPGQYTSFASLSSGAHRKLLRR